MDPGKRHALLTEECQRRERRHPDRCLHARHRRGPSDRVSHQGPRRRRVTGPANQDQNRDQHGDHPMTRPPATHSRRRILQMTAGAALATPFLSIRAAAQTVNLSMLAWYGHAEPDIVGAFEEANNVKFVPKYYAGGDNMLGLIAQSPPGTYDLILSDGEFVQQLNAAGYIEEMDASLFPFDDFFPAYQNFPGHWTGDQLWSVMVRFGLLGVSYNS